MNTRRIILIFFLTALAVVSVVYFRPHGVNLQYGAVLAWQRPQPILIVRDSFSSTHNDMMEFLWNDLRLREHWDFSDSEVLESYFVNSVTYTGTDWDDAPLEQNEEVIRYMIAANLFAEHILIGGTIDGAGVIKIKERLIQDLIHPIVNIRFSAAAGLIQVNALGDSALLARLRTMENDPNVTVRSVVKVQFQNLANRQKAAPR